MAVTITMNGNDDLALDQLAALADVPVPSGRNTDLRAQEVAESAGVSVGGFVGNARLLLEKIAALIAVGPVPEPYVLRLDDDGSMAAALGFLYMPAIAPDYLQASHDFISTSEPQEFLTAPAAIEDAAAVSSGVVAFQVNVSGFPSSAGGASMAAGLAFALLGGAGIVYQGSVSVSIGNEGAKLRIKEDLSGGLYEYELAGFAGGLQKIAMYIDVETGRAGVAFNGVDYGWFDELNPALGVAGAVSGVVPAFYLKQHGTQSGSNSVLISAIQGPSGIDQPLPAGTETLDGTVI